MPGKTRRRRWGNGFGALGVALLALTLSGCSQYPFSPIKPAGLVARQDDNLYEVVTVIAFGVFLIVGGLIVYAATRYWRRRSATRQEPLQVFGNSTLELTWTFIPLVIVALLFTLAVQTLEATAVPARTPRDALVIRVIGHQWNWEYSYDTYPGVDYTEISGATGLTDADAMHIPVHRTVVLKITGADVQHGWWVPALAGKNEAIPGHVNVQQFVAEQTGSYYAICSYYCGIYHYNMRARVIVDTPAAFAAWLDTKRHGTPAAAPTSQATPRGSSTPIGGSTPSTLAVSFSKDIQSIFTAHCAACHIQQQLGGLNLANYQGLVKGGNVVPGSVFRAGDHKTSYLWQIVQPNAPWPGGNRMPLGGPYLTDAQIQTIAAWIDQGARNN